MFRENRKREAKDNRGAGRMKDYKLVITIDGESAKDLFAVGPNDLRDYFLPDTLNVDSNDIARISFHEDVPLMERLSNETSIHSDNYYRDKLEELEE